jgi:hypothetical protein
MDALALKRTTFYRHRTELLQRRLIEVDGTGQQALIRISPEGAALIARLSLS